ncbi:hypothetical protein BFW01_g7069 [Lasiodiplodia theobromae]|nr:hypothetical protein BFW01_g7069 [Lasiodiplodia theobromae]
MAIPEPFLWYLLRCLAEAVAVLDGENLFHFDIKPPNILLARADDSNTSHHWHQNYPTVLLADFGGVNEKSAKDEEHRGMGTPGFNPWIGQVILTGMRPFWPDSQLWDIPQPPWEAPDQPAPSDDQRKAYEYYCYQISRTDWPKRHPRRARNEQNHSMENVEALKEAFFPGKRDKDIETDPLFDALTLRAYDDASADTPLTSYRPSNAVDPHFSALRPQYSARLVECVFRCLEPLPADRPTVQDVLEEARDVCRADFERAWPGYPEMGSRQMGVGVEPDEYAPYRMRPVVPGPRPWRKGDEDDRNWKQLEAPMWLMIRRDKYPISKKVLNDKYKGE